MDSALKKEIETLIAAALVPCQKRIARLEQEVKELKGTLNIVSKIKCLSSIIFCQN